MTVYTDESQDLHPLSSWAHQSEVVNSMGHSQTTTVANAIHSPLDLIRFDFETETQRSWMCPSLNNCQVFLEKAQGCADYTLLAICKTSYSHILPIFT